MKYELLLRDIYKHTERAGLLQEIPNLQEAIYVMKVCNLFRAFSSFFGFQFSFMIITIEVIIIYKLPIRLFQKLPTI